jgi:hypothetical protein
MSRIRRGSIPALMLNEQLLGFDRVELIGHARVRLKQRRITLEEVFQAIRKPDQINLPTAPGCQRVRWNKSVNYSIDVVFDLPGDRVRIITVMRVTDALRGVAPKIFKIGRSETKRRHNGKHRR